MRHNATASNRHNSPKNKPSSNLKMMGSVRVRVIRSLLAIQQGQSLSSVLDPLLNSLHEGDKGFAHALLLTTLRQWYALARLLDSLADNPIDEIEVRTTIQVGLVQLLYLEVADHAAIHETVEAAKELEFARAAGLINAILRKVAKNPNKFRKKCDKNHSLPNWLAHQLKQDWSDDYSALTQGLRQPAPMFLRVNTMQGTVAHYQQQLLSADIEADLVELSSGLSLPHASETSSASISVPVLRLAQSTAVSFLPHFSDGAVSVQDMHAQLAAPLIQLALTNKVTNDIDSNNIDSSKNELHLLDACAAPGGKLAHWLELLNSADSILNQPSTLFHVKPSDLDNHSDVRVADKISSIKLTAIDSEATRIARIHENVERLQLATTLQADSTAPTISLDIVCADATRWQQASDSELAVFDAIVLDSPCTATGVIRRHPDISLLRNEEDVTQTAVLQADILHNLWPQLKQGGYLLYITCSILKQENVAQMQDFIKHHDDATAIDFTAGCNWGMAQDIGRQCLPIEPTGGDGFYYALLQKTVK